VPSSGSGTVATIVPLGVAAFVQGRPGAGCTLVGRGLEIGLGRFLPVPVGGAPVLRDVPEAFLRGALVDRGGTLVAMGGPLVTMLRPLVRRPRPLRGLLRVPVGLLDVLGLGRLALGEPLEAVGEFPCALRRLAGALGGHLAGVGGVHASILPRSGLRHTGWCAAE
jgi:hypothetical protein